MMFSRGWNTEGWADRDFLLEAEVMAYPAQPLAGAGLAVLLMNRPVVRTGSSEEFAWRDGVEGAIEALDHEGLIDRSRLGMTGFSHAVGIVEFVLEQSRYQFGAAVVIDSNINSYLADALHDGRPASGPALEPREFARDLNAEKIHAPLLLEAHGIPTAVGMFSVFNGLRLAHRPTELQYYLEEDHDLVSPASQMSALTRQIDWYRFWLKSEEDPVPSKALQYARWRKLKELQQ